MAQDVHTADEGSSPDTAGAVQGPASFPRRVLWTFVAPERLAENLKQHPRWLVPMLVGAALVVLATVLIPAELWVEMIRRQMLESGQTMPEGFDPAAMGTFQRIGAIVAGAVFWFVWALVMAGIATLVFAFILGDDGRFRQYFSVTAHALLIPAVGGLLTVPLRLAQGDPMVTLNLGLFLPLDDGYLANLLRSLDLFVLWSWLVLAVGVHVIDRRRSLGSAAAVLLTVAVAFAAIGAFFQP